MNSIAAQVGKVSANLETATRSGEFISIVRHLMAAGGDATQALEMAQAGRASERVVTCLRAAVAGGTTTGGMAALADYRTAVGGFLGTLRNGAFDAMLPSMLQLPLHTRISVSTTGITGSTVAEASIKPISSIALSSTTLEASKAVAQIITSKELVRLASPAAGALVASELRNAIGNVTDTLFFSLILSGITPVASSGGGVAQVRSDLSTALDLISTGASSKLFFIMSSSVGKRLSLMGDSTGGSAFPQMTPQGGSIGGVTALISDGLPANTIVAADASQIAAGDEGLQVVVGQHATVVADTVPDSPPAATTVLISLWQHDLVATRAERYFGATRLRSNAVSAINNINYSGNSPA